MDGPNVYLYVHNNPINFIDPLGLSDKDTPTIDIVDVESGTVDPKRMRESVGGKAKIDPHSDPNSKQLKKIAEESGSAPGDILIYIGHGESDPEGGLYVIAATGKPMPGESSFNVPGEKKVAGVSAKRLAEWLTADGAPPTVVVLACCDSDEIGEQLRKAGVGLVIAGGTRDNTGDAQDTANANFIKGFVEAFAAKGKTLNEAVSAGNKAASSINDGYLAGTALELSSESAEGAGNFAPYQVLSGNRYNNPGRKTYQDLTYQESARRNRSDR